MPRIGSTSNAIQESKTGIQFTRVPHWRFISNLKGIIRKTFWNIPNRSTNITEQEEESFETGCSIFSNALRHPFTTHLSHQTISWIVSTVDEAALKGCAYTVLPEALGDMLCLYHFLNAKNAEYLKMAANLVLVALSGSWLSSGAAWLTNATLQKAGCSETSSKMASDCVAMAIHIIRNLSAVALATTVIGYIAGKLGLWIEKRAIQQLVSEKKTDNNKHSPEDLGYIPVAP